MPRTIDWMCLDRMEKRLVALETHNKDRERQNTASHLVHYNRFKLLEEQQKEMAQLVNSNLATLQSMIDDLLGRLAELTKKH